VRELVAFLKWWSEPANSLSGGVFLRAPWMGVPDALLDQWIKQDPTWLGPFLAYEHPIARALARARSRALRPGALLLELLVDGQTGDAIEDELGSALLGLWHRVEELSGRGYEFHEVVAELDLALKQGRRERDVPPPRNLGQLQVLTLHGSKGLEFPHVILLDFGKKGRRPHAPLLFWDRREGAALMPRDSEGERDPKGPLEAEWRKREEGKDLAESKRLFYVALTRAQERLILVCPALEEKAEAEIADKGEALLKVDYWRAWIEVAGGEIPRAEFAAPSRASLSLGGPEHPALASPSDRALDRAAECTGDRTGEIALPPPRAIRPRHSVTEWVTLDRCPRAYEWTYLRPPAHAPANRRSIHTGWSLTGDADGEAGLPTRELGTRVHAALEVGNWDELAQLEREAGPDRFRAEPLTRWAEASPWMRPTRPAGLPGAPGDERRVWSELALEVPIAGAVLVGSVDRLCLENGRLAVVDFKVTEKEKDPAELARTYRIQLELYADALRRLDPEAAWAKHPVRGVLVQISGGRVTEVEVELQGIDAEELATRASRIVAGETGPPTPGAACRNCDFRKICDTAAPE
jgi:hypothetical protein